MQPDPFEESLKSLLPRFRVAMNERREALEALFVRIVDCPFDQEAVTSFAAISHQIAGIAGTFGLTKIGEEAKVIEVILSDKKLQNPTPHELINRLDAFISDIADAMKKSFDKG